ncbi:MAG: hypothetical protein ACTMKV_00020 [Sphingomonas parapaucimobilis]
MRISIVWAALFMNFFLALANANGIGMTGNIVLGIQLLITGTAILVILYQPPRVGPDFIFAITAILVGYLVSGIYHGSIDPRGLYDIFIIPIFMMLGMTLHKLKPWMINAPMSIIVLVALADGLLRDQYASIVNPLSYYRSTRAWVADQDSAFREASGLYVGADRSGGLVFSFLSDHRVGSIFLEPLSLGYFGVIAAIAYAVVYDGQRNKFLFAASICLFLALLADTRTAAFLVIVTVCLVLSAKKLPVAITYIIPVVVMFLGAVVYLNYHGGGGDLLFRLGLTYREFFNSNSLSLLVGNVTSDQIYDSGIINIIQNVGLISAIVLIYLVSGGFGYKWSKFSFVPLVTVIYVMVTLLFGGAVFSIKTAAMLGVIIGRSGRMDDLSIESPD